jgi:hypothetical protein
MLITRDSLIALIAMKPKTTSLNYPGYLDYLNRRERLVAAFYENKHAGTPLEQLAHSYQPGIVLRLSLVLQSSGFGCPTTPGLYTYIQRNKWYWLMKGTLIAVSATSHVGHSTRNEAAVTLTLIMWHLFPFLYGWTVIWTHFQYVNIYNSLDCLVRYTTMTDDICIAHDRYYLQM